MRSSTRFSGTWDIATGEDHDNPAPPWASARMCQGCVATHRGPDVSTRSVGQLERLSFHGQCAQETSAPASRATLLARPTTHREHRQVARATGSRRCPSAGGALNQHGSRAACAPSTSSPRIAVDIERSAAPLLEAQAAATSGRTWIDHGTLRRRRRCYPHAVPVLQT